MDARLLNHVLDMAKLLPLIFALLFTPFTAFAKSYTGFYDKLAKPQDTGVGKDRVQVLSFFSYGCKACKDFDVELQAWLDKNTRKIVFQRVPSTFVRNGKQQARIYYTAQEFKAKPKLHQSLYSKISKGQLVLDRNDLLANFLSSRLGRDSFSVEIAMDSMAVNSALLYAEDLSNKYQASSLPAFVVNGRYRTSLKQAGSTEKLFEVLEYLIDLELNSYRYQSW